MAYKTCEDCGCKLYSGACNNCHEETFIYEQNYSKDEPIAFSEDFKEKVIEQEILDEVQKLLKDQYLVVKRVLVEDVKLPPTIRTAIETKLKQEQESLEYEFRLAKAKKEAERQKIDAEGKATANRILSASLTEKILQDTQR